MAKVKNIIVTGSAGFIGFHLSLSLLKDGYNVIGIDSIDDYYSTKLKIRRLRMLEKFPNYKHLKIKVENPDLTNQIDQQDLFAIVHLAAQAGVRYSIEHPDKYFDSNISGSYNIIKLAKERQVNHLLLASTSSVYGANEELPFGENQKADTQISFYAATKKAMETMSHSYSHMFRTPTTIFRFFTVYGPWGRPDMALYKFAKAMKDGTQIDVYNHGNMERDFTYIDDLVTSISKLINVPPVSGHPISDIDSLSPVAPWRVVNIGNSKPVPLMNYIKCLEKNLGIEANKNYMPLQMGDVPKTSAQTELLNSLIDYVPGTTIEDGVRQFCQWFEEYNNSKH
jgi:UDP-glucuronate 4-epimerase